MRNARIPLFGNPMKSVIVNPAATEGATVGRDLIGPDGKLVSAATWQRLLGGTTGAPAATPSAPAAADIGTTDELQEGAFNLYYTPARVDARIAAHDTVPCFLTDDTYAPMALTSDLKIPAFLSDGTEADLPLAA